MAKKKAPGSAPKKTDPDFIEHMHMDKGGLHRALGIPEGRDIPESVLRSAANSHNHRVAREAKLAETLERINPHKGKGDCPDG